MPRFRSHDPWRVLWQIATSNYLLGTVLLALALALLLAAWLPQTSLGGSALDVAWQAQVQRRFGEVAWFDAIRSPLQAIGAFHVADAAWFRFLLALLALSLCARLVDNAEGLWHGWRGGAPPEEGTWVAMEGALDELVDRLRGRRLRVVTKSGDGAENELTDGAPSEGMHLVRADRWPWGDLGPVLVYLGGLVALLGAAVTTLWGWRTEPLRLTAGESVPLGHGSSLTLQLEDLTHDGRRGVGQIWRGGDTLVGAGDLAVGRPLAGGGVGAYLLGSGAGLRVQATMSDTQVLELATRPDKEGQEELVLIFTDDEPRHPVGVPGAELVLLLTMPQPARMGALPQVQVFESGSGQFILEQEVPADTILRIGDVSFALTPVPYAELQVVRDPGVFWIQLGVVWLIVGAVLWGLWTPRRLWLRRQTDPGELPGTIEAVGDLGLLSAPESKPARPDSSGS
jgi:hypothetical protein